MKKQPRCITQKMHQKTPTTKLLAALMAVVLTAGMMFAFAGCSSTDEPTGTETSGTDFSGNANIANPIVEVDSVDTVNEELSIHLVVPDDATIENCAIIADLLGEVNFELNGQHYNHRGQVAETDEDISGLYYDFAVNETNETAGQTYTLEYNESGPGYAHWYDDISGTIYSVSVTNGATSTLLNDIAVTLIAAQKLM